MGAQTLPTLVIDYRAGVRLPNGSQMAISKVLPVQKWGVGGAENVLAMLRGEGPKKVLKYFQWETLEVLAML